MRETNRGSNGVREAVLTTQHECGPDPLIASSPASPSNGPAVETYDAQLALLDHIPGCMAMILRNGTLEIVACNSLARQAGAIPGQTCFATVAKRSEPCPFCQAPQLWKTGQPQHVEVNREGAWRREIWASLSDDLCIQYVFDISERKRAEEALRESQELFSSFLRHSPVYTFIKEVTPSESRVLQASDNYLELVGITAQQMRGRAMSEIFPPEFAAKVTADDWAVLEAGSVLQLEEDLDDRHYTTIKFPITIGERQLLAGYTIDITDRRRSEKAQAESERRLATLMANLPGMVYRCQNDQDWTMLFVSEGCEQLTGYAASQLIGSAGVAYGDLIHPDDREKTWQRVQGQVAAREPFDLLYRIVTAGGGAKWAWERGRGVFDDDGALLFLEGFVTDVSERVEAERALRERDDQLRQSQKMEAVGQLAGGIAHDFNNLLAIILGYSDFLLADDSLADSSAREKVEEIRRAADRAASLTNQILAFSRRQPLRPTVVSFNDVVAGMEGLLRRTLGEDIEFVAHLALDLERVEADVNQFEQVLMNLAVNARDAMSPGGRLTVETANVRLDGDDHYVAAEPALCSHVMLAVSDTGIGMEEDTRERAFEPFFTTKGPGSGTGLGLSTVYGIVKQSHGAIDVVSEPDRGTTFRIYLPRVVGEPATEPPETPQTSMPIGREMVLVVEDEDALRTLMAEVLRGYGFRVLSSATAAEALRLIETEGERPDVLVTDVVLPGGMQGNELAERLVSLLPGLPVLFVSGYSRDAIVHQGRLDASVNLLEKPFSPKVLAETLREMLNQHPPKKRS